MKTNRTESICDAVQRGLFDWVCNSHSFPFPCNESNSHFHYHSFSFPFPSNFRIEFPLPPLMISKCLRSHRRSQGVHWGQWRREGAPGANIFVAAPTPAIRSPIVILMVTTMALVWTVNSTLSWGCKISEFHILPLQMPPMHSAARGGCLPSPLPLPAANDWGTCTLRART